MQLLLPPELKHRIVKLSSHDSLASLARTHSAYQREAEQALYRSLPNPSLNCLKTLATNSEKAGFVRFLTMERAIDPHNNSDRQWAIHYLLNALVNMHSLSDFRLRMPWCYGDRPWIDTLNKILWSVYELGSFLIFRKLTSGDTVTIIFDYKPCSAMSLSTFLKSSRVRPKCRCLEHATMKSGLILSSNGFRILNYTSLWSSD